MGILCTKDKDPRDPGFNSDSILACRHEFFRRCSSKELNCSFNPCSDAQSGQTLLISALQTAASNLDIHPTSMLKLLPPDLAQLLLTHLITTNQLNDRAIHQLSNVQWQFFHLDLTGLPATDTWLQVLVSANMMLDTLILRDTLISDAALLYYLPSSSSSSPPLLLLPRLSTLNLSDCPHITDTGIWSVSHHLPQLTQLSLDGCEGLTNKGLAYIGNIHQLEILGMARCNNITNLHLLTTTTNNNNTSSISSLDLGWCINIKDPSPLACLTNLVELRLGHTAIDRNLDTLKSLSKLTLLNLGGLRSGGDSGSGGGRDNLNNNNNRRRGGNDSGGLRRALSGMPLLQTLSLERFEAVDDECLEVIATTCGDMRQLDLSYCCDITDRGLLMLKSLVELRTLNLDSCCEVGDVSMSVLLPCLSLLVSLDVSDTKAKGGMVAVLRHLPHLHSLDMAFTDVDDAHLQKIKKMPEMRHLNLDCRLVTDTGLERVCNKLPNLESLDLFGARISDAGCYHISKLDKLQSLELCGGGVTDVGVARLTNLKQLRHLNLGMNFRITTACIPHILSFKQLRSLNLSQCHIIGSGVFNLCALEHLELLSLHNTRVQKKAVVELRLKRPGLRIVGVEG